MAPPAAAQCRRSSGRGEIALARGGLPGYITQ